MAEVELLRVAAGTSAKTLAGAIASIIHKGNNCELLAIGAGPVNQAVKALTIARSLTSTFGKDLMFKTGWETLDLSNEIDAAGKSGKPEVSMIKFFVVVI